MIELRQPDAIEAMREGGKILGRVLSALMQEAREGMSTLQLDAFAEALITESGARASFKGYRGFPASICTSINDEIVHGIPRADRILKNGDLLKLDIGIYHKGYHTDAGRTVAIGTVAPVALQLMEVTEKSFFAGLQAVRDGSFVNEIGKNIEKYAEKAGFGIVRELVGHGVGRQLHEDPEIPNFYRADLRIPLKAGMTLAIEPMLTQGSWKIRTLRDRWTIATTDGKLSAYYENTVLVTGGDPEILTATS